MVVLNQSLGKRVEKIKGNNEEINILISEFKPFIASVAQKRAGKFLKFGIDDELSIALMAFKESIDAYDGKKGKFLSFSRVVINMRLIDYYRKQIRLKESAISDKSDDYHKPENIDMKSMEKYRMDQEKEARILEIIEYRKKLAEWRIDMERLAGMSPKKDSLRLHYIKVAKVIVKNRNLLEILLKTGRLPLKEIEEVMLTHRKKLERGRIYIIAVVIAIVNKYDFIDFAGSRDGDKT